MDAATKRFVRSRAGRRCEYCLLHQDDSPFVVLQIEHIVPKKHDGGDEDENLALACPHCNNHKGPNLTGLDPETGEIAILFDPRRMIWIEHFAREGPSIVGLTAVGRTTVRVLKMNAPSRIVLRSQ